MEQMFLLLQVAFLENAVMDLSGLVFRGSVERLGTGN
jgi:hypothetical protein